MGSSLALMLKRDRPADQIRVFDNLRRRGSELSIARLTSAGVEFTHGDVRSPDDLAEAGAFDVLLECSAEPSVHAGYEGSPSYVLHTNLTGTIHCLEAARRFKADVVFLSTSRVYPIETLRALPLEQRGSRLDIAEGASGKGWSTRGVSTDFPLARLSIDVWGDQTCLGAAPRGVSRDVWPPHGREPLRCHCRALADGQGRSGICRVVGFTTPVRRPPHLYRFRWRGTSDSRRAPRGGSLRPHSLTA